MILLKDPPNNTNLDKMQKISTLCKNMKPEQWGSFILSCEPILFPVEANDMYRRIDLGKGRLGCLLPLPPLNLNLPDLSILLFILCLTTAFWTASLLADVS